MKKLILMAAIVAVSMSSCSENEIAVNETAENAISFDTYTGVAARGSVLTDTRLKTYGFGVLAYDQGEKTAFSDQTPNYMYNTELYYSGGVWAYDLTKYWATSTTNYYSFFAYSPYESAPTAGTSQGIVLSADSETGAPTITFTLQADADDMVDLVAGQIMNINKYGNVLGETATSTSVSSVDLNFKHQLTRATFKAKSGFSADETFVNIKSFRILGTNPTLQNATVTGTAVGTSYDSKYGSTALYNSAIYTFDTETTNDTYTNHDQDGKWAYSYGSGVYDKTSEGYDLETILNKTSNEYLSYNGTTSTYRTDGIRLGSGSNASLVSLFDANQYVFLIPPYRTTGITSTYYIQVELVYDIVTVDSGLTDNHAVSSADNYAIVTLTDETLKQGYAYEFLFTITGSAIVDPSKPDTATSASDAVKITGNMVDWDETASNYTTYYTL